MINSPNDIWEHVLEILREKLTQVAINTWFNECSVLSVTDSRLVLCIPSDFKRNIVESRFKVDIMNALRELFSGEFDVSFVGLSEIKEADEKEMTRFGETEVYSFSNFVVGNSNKFAYAAAKAVADEQGKDYANPLFIYGESGLGKTHLLYAIRNQLKKAHPEYYIVLIRGGDFVTELITAIQTGRSLEFKEKYKSADVFLVDDIQVIAGKDRTEEEVFHIFNTLYEAQKQIVLTSDRPPEEMLLLPERLKSRFSSGLLADITVPDYETRMAIIMKKSNQLGLTLSNEVMDFIAKKITANIRQLEGA
ncbi:MAG: ATP-binding protein, partial [Oscillospiraceae bacterium]|nr:ATP-binding protein [Oscillospiraceae bacterium]